jgi:hypothetical protein
MWGDQKCKKGNGYPGEWSKHAKEMIKWQQNTWSKKERHLPSVLETSPYLQLKSNWKKTW